MLLLIGLTSAVTGVAEARPGLVDRSRRSAHGGLKAGEVGTGGAAVTVEAAKAVVRELVGAGNAMDRAAYARLLGPGSSTRARGRDHAVQRRIRPIVGPYGATTRVYDVVLSAVGKEHVARKRSPTPLSRAAAAVPTPRPVVRMARPMTAHTSIRDVEPTWRPRDAMKKRR
jgi:hypothetical protein